MLFTFEIIYELITLSKKDETNLEVSRLGKVFRVYDSSRDRLKQINPFSNKTYYRDFRALDDINFSVKRGECLGVVGKNGSGKSTLLKIISKTLRPTEGQVKMDGRCFALLELGTDLNEDLTVFRILLIWQYA